MLVLEGTNTTEQNVSNQDNFPVSPEVTTEYTLTASNSADEVEKSITVTVNLPATTCEEDDYTITNQAECASARGMYHHHG